MTQPEFRKKQKTEPVTSGTRPNDAPPTCRAARPSIIGGVCQVDCHNSCRHNGRLVKKQN